MMELDVFRESIMRSTEILRQFDIDLCDLMMNGDRKTYSNTINSFIGIASIQVRDLFVWSDRNSDTSKSSNKK